MSSYDEKSIAEIEALFANLKENSFAKSMTGSVPYEDLPGSRQIAPAGFTADSAIEQVVGFAWEDFSTAGIYNSSFFLGVQDEQFVSTYNNPVTTEQYLSGLSKQLPYWQVNAPGGNPTLQKVDDATAVGEKALQWSGSNVDAMIVQDIPVVPGKVYKIRMVWRYDNSGGSEFSRTFGWQFRKGDHSAIGSLTEGGLSFTDTQATYIETNLTSNFDLVAPANARFLRIRLTMAATLGNPTILVNSLSATTDNSGDDFPANPSHHDRWFEQDSDMEFFWDNNIGKWLSTTLYHMPFSAHTTGITATGNLMIEAPPPLNTAADIWLEQFRISVFIGAGTALSASHKWAWQLDTVQEDSVTTTTITNDEFASGAIQVWRDQTKAISALLDDGAHKDVLQVVFTKTGTPGSVTAAGIL